MKHISKGSSPDNPTAKSQATILVVEDEQPTLGMLEKFLSGQGYHVLLAADGEQAIEAYCTHKTQIDAVLLDLDLPKVKGVNVLFKMKSENPDVRVVVTSGYLEPRVKAEMYRAGVRDFLTKPYIPDELMELIQNLIVRT
jgi:two-component system cell cycle sensor histidine kinase/response regulator CckA